jgi:hypothetical protein
MARRPHFGGEQPCAIGFCRTSITAPEIDFPRHGGTDLGNAAGTRFAIAAAQRRALSLCDGLAIDSGELIGPRDPEQRLGLKNPTGGNPHVVVLVQRSRNQLSKDLVGDDG